MPKKITTADFVAAAKTVHGDLYDYSEVEYVNSHTKVQIIDPEFGPFEQTPASHLQGKGNPRRGIQKSNAVRTMNTEQFIKKALEVHGELYDYSKVEYKSTNTKVLIIDPAYGAFEQTPVSHLQGVGHPSRSVSGRKKSTLEQFIANARKVHGDLYDYSNVVYVNSQTKVLIVDPVHGGFEQTPGNHLAGHGCPKRR